VRTVTLEVSFSAGHRLLGHKGKCRHLHGHNYTAVITAARKDGWVDEMGMVVDFGDLKEVAKGWIDANWDHNMVLNEKDKLAELAKSELALTEIFGGKPPFMMQWNPTAENMARILCLALYKKDAEYRILSVEIRETPTCSASYSGE
jgi:6-pyruvoyltetrahydropterin/6-carboxytetrahydropterin synthase